MKEEKDVNITGVSVASNLIWRFLERFGAYFISFAISIVLARILDPQIYGTVAIVTVFITFFEVLVTGGLGNSLIRKKDATSLDFNTIFWFNICSSIILYLIIFAAAPFIANFYGKPLLKYLLWVSGITVFISGIKNVEYAYVARNLKFKKFFFATIGGTIFSGVIGILLALNGFGPWALVISSVSNHFIDVVILSLCIKWKPRFEFSMHLLKEHWNYGWKILCSKVLSAVYGDFRQLVIGKYYSDSDLAFFNRGKTYPNMFVTNIANSINSIMFPVLSKKNSNPSERNAIIVKSIKVNSYVLFPIMAGMAVVAEPFVLLLLTQKWLSCVPYLRVFCFVYALIPFEIIINSAILANGKSGTVLLTDCIKAAVGISGLFISLKYGVGAITIALVCSSIFDLCLNLFVAKKVLKISIRSMVAAVLPNIVLTFFMAFTVYCFRNISSNQLIVLPVQVFVGIFIYFALSKFMNNESFTYCINLAKKMFCRKGKK